MNPSFRRTNAICFVLAGLGFAVSGYLLVRTFSLLVGESVEAVDVCTTVFGTGCDETLLSPSSRKLGIPLAGWGVVYFGALACLLIMAWALGKSFESEATLGTIVLSVFGCCASLWLVALMLTGPAPFCPLCAVVHVINLLLLATLVVCGGRTIGQLAESLKLAGKYLLGGEVDAPEQAAWKMVGFFTAGLLATVLYQWVLIETDRRASTGQEEMDRQVLAAYQRAPTQDIPVADDDPRLGPADAPVELVVFSSFQCPGCRQFVGELYQVTKLFPEELRVVFKHYPLGKDCNPTLEVDMQPRACEAAWAAQSAHEQGEFWSFHDALFAADLQTHDDAIDQIAERSGIDVARFISNRGAPATLEKIKRDVELGDRLGVDGTPAIFLNGRRVRHVSAQALFVLVRHLLDAPQT